jgi:hypothetical protein
MKVGIDCVTPTTEQSRAKLLYCTFTILIATVALSRIPEPKAIQPATVVPHCIQQRTIALKDTDSVNITSGLPSHRQSVFSSSDKFLHVE